MALLAFTFSLNAQQFVSTTPANRNVILEEFTGRGCQYCPDGHRIANEIAAAHPGRFWAINIHAGGYAQTSYPNFITPDGNTIHGGFSISGYPTGVVNRSTAAGQDRDQWNNMSTTQMNQLSECNVGGLVVVDPETRVATIVVEVYYTGNSSTNENYLTVAMLQDSILGSQSGGSTWNPGQMINGQYVHMHVLRDVITESAWGEAISPTTQGTLITRTYEYAIPENIGGSNGVDVDLNNIFFLAWVSERYQGTPTRPIMTGCELLKVFASDAPVSPAFVSVEQYPYSTCTNTKIVEAHMINCGSETLTSMKLSADLDGVIYNVDWEGSLAQYSMETIEIPVEVPFGNYNVKVEVVEANGQHVGSLVDVPVSCVEWGLLQIEGEEEQLRLELMQDKFGNQITWEFTSSDGRVLASGGPYTMLMGGTATQMHLEYVDVSVGECVNFTIYDSGDNGICCNTGIGYYIVKDSHGNVVFGDENDGDFGSEASHLISVIGEVQVSVGETEVNGINYNHADFAAPLEYEGYPDEVGFVCRKVTSAEPMIIQGFLNEFHNILGFTDDLEPSTIYMVKAYATVNGETYYGTETTFQTWMEGVDELTQTLKIYPNPTSSVLNIKGESMTSVEVYNAMGQRVMMMEANDNALQLNTESLSNGMYVVRIHANDGTVLNRTFSVAR